MPGSHKTGCSEDKTSKSDHRSKSAQELSELCTQVRLSLSPSLNTVTPKSQLGLNWCILAVQWWWWFVTLEPVGLSTPGFASLHAPPLDNPEALFCVWRGWK